MLKTYPLLLLWFSILAYAQTATVTPSTYHARNAYTLVHPAITLANTSLVMTVQVPATGGYDAQFATLTLSLPGSGSCLITIERDGSVATGTSTPITRTNPGVMTSRPTHLEAFTQSDSTGGTVVARHLIMLGAPVTIKIASSWVANPTGSGNRTGYTARQNLTVRTCNATGAATGNIDWTETAP